MATSLVSEKGSQARQVLQYSSQKEKKHVIFICFAVLYSHAVVPFHCSILVLIGIVIWWRWAVTPDLIWFIVLSYTLFLQDHEEKLVEVKRWHKWCIRYQVTSIWGSHCLLGTQPSTISHYNKCKTDVCWCKTHVNLIRFKWILDIEVQVQLELEI